MKCAFPTTEPAKAEEGLMEWQPIETAPKDGTWVLLWWPHLHHAPQTGQYSYGWHCHVPSFADEGPGPLNWMPLPVPPTTEPAKAEEAQ